MYSHVNTKQRIKVRWSVKCDGVAPLAGQGVLSEAEC